MSIQASIEGKLKKAFSPERLAVINESHLHAGHHHVEDGHHAEFDGKGETHFRVRLVSLGIRRHEPHRAPPRRQRGARRRTQGRPARAGDRACRAGRNDEVVKLKSPA